MKKTFVQATKEKFEYLVKDYKFEILSAADSPRGYFWEGEINYATKVTYVYIECTRGENPSFFIGRSKDVDPTAGINKISRMLPFNLIYEYMTTTHEEKDGITSSREPKQTSKIIYQDKHIGLEFPTRNNSEEGGEFELEVYARLINNYARPFLLGDFFQWPDIWDYSVRKGVAQHISYGRSEYVDVVIPDRDGKYRRIGKKHLYQDELDYIKRLNAELKRR